jgi:hypothetical protein
MKRQDALQMNRRMVLRGAGGLMLGLPLLEGFMPRKAAAQTAMRSPFVLLVVGDNGVVQAGVSLSVASEPEKFWPTATGALTTASMTADKATRSTGELAAYADKLLIVKGVNLPSARTAARTRRRRADPDGGEDHHGRTNCKAMGISVDTAIAKAKNPPGREPLVMHAGMFSPGGTGFDIPGYVSYITPQQARVYIDSPYKAYQQIIGVIGNGTTMTTAEQQAQMQRARAARASTTSFAADPGPARAAGAQSERPHPPRSAPDGHPRHRGEDRDHAADVHHPRRGHRDDEGERPQALRPVDPRRVGQAVHGPDGLLRRGGLQPGGGLEDRRPDRRPRVHLQRDVSEVPRRVAPAGLQRDRLPPLPRSHDAQLLQVPARQGVDVQHPDGSAADQGVTIYCNQCATGAHSFSNIPWIQAGTANGYFKKGQYVVVGSGQQPGGSQDGKGGDGSVSGVNKMLKHPADGGRRDEDGWRADR